MNDRIDVFTPEEVERAAEIVREEDLGRLVSRLKNEIVTEEVMARIDRETGQENDRRYMAYRLEWVARTVS